MLQGIPGQARDEESFVSSGGEANMSSLRAGSPLGAGGERKPIWFLSLFSWMVFLNRAFPFDI